MGLLPIARCAARLPDAPDLDALMLAWIIAAAGACRLRGTDYSWLI
jgi:hypothetical protein